MKLAVPDMISPSYFPAIAAAELGFFREEGIDVEVELIFPVDRAYMALRDGAVDFVGGSAHSTPHAFPNWKGGKILAAQAQHMYWFLILRADLNAKKGDINAVKGLKIAAAPLVNLGLKRLLAESGIDEKRDNVQIQIPAGPRLVVSDLNMGVFYALAVSSLSVIGILMAGWGSANK